MSHHHSRSLSVVPRFGSILLACLIMLGGLFASCGGANSATRVTSGSHDLASTLRAVPSDARAVLVIDHQKLRVENPHLLASINRIGGGDAGEQDACWEQVQASLSWMVLAASYPLDPTNVYIAVGTNSEPDCAATEYPSAEVQGPIGVLRRVAPGVYLGAATKSQADAWTKGHEPHEFSRELISGHKGSAIRFVVHAPEVVQSLLTTDYEEKGSLLEISGAVFADDQIRLALNFVWSAAEDSAVAKSQFVGSTKPLLEGLGYGDFVAVFFDGMSVTLADRTLMVVTKIPSDKLPALFERIEFNQPTHSPLGTPMAQFAVFPVGILNGAKLRRDRDTGMMIRKMENREGYLALFAMEGVSHSRITEAVELLSLGGMPVYVSSVRSPWTDALTGSCLEVKHSLLCRNIGFAYRQGFGVPTDEVKATKMFKVACDGGDRVSCEAIPTKGKVPSTSGWSYGVVGGVLTEKYDSPAFLRKKAQAEKGTSVDLFEIGRMYSEGDGIPLDYSLAAKWYLKAAKKGHADAQTTIAWYYEEGKGLAKDDKEAIRWSLAAAKQGQYIAQSNLGRMYKYGRGTEVDYNKAFKWFARAAEQGHPRALFELGSLYENGHGTAKDHHAASKNYRKAALQEFAQAQHSLALMYEAGLGVVQNQASAVEWFKKAAQLRNGPSQYRLATHYESGAGGEKNIDEAAKWYEKAARQGDLQGQLELGFCYYEGRGLPQDYAKAYAWLALSASLGESKAEEKRDLALASIPIDARAAAEALYKRLKVQFGSK